MESVVGIGVPSKYFDLPVLSLGSTATVTLKRANRVRPQRTKNESRRWSTGVRTPSAKAAAAGAIPKEIFNRKNRQPPSFVPLHAVFASAIFASENYLTRSANESSSCPMREDLPLHRAILPSMKSKNRPKGMNARAAQMAPCSLGSPRQYRIDERTDMTGYRLSVTGSLRWVTWVERYLRRILSHVSGWNQKN